MYFWVLVGALGHVSWNLWLGICGVAAWPGWLDWGTWLDRGHLHGCTYGQDPVKIRSRSGQDPLKIRCWHPFREQSRTDSLKGVGATVLNWCFAQVDWVDGCACIPGASVLASLLCARLVPYMCMYDFVFLPTRNSLPQWGLCAGCGQKSWFSVFWGD